jgi:hypothetical protein
MAKLYTNLDLSATGDVVPGSQTVVTTGLWSNDAGTLEGSTLFLNTTQLGNSGEYYFDTYDVDASSSLAEVQFSVTYGHVNGGGAPPLSQNNLATLPTQAIYGQYRNLLLPPGTSNFLFPLTNGVSSDHIYVINLQRARVKEQLDPGNWQLPLSGQNGLFTFIDDSFQTLGTSAVNSRAGRVFNVVSGSITTAAGSITSSATYAGGRGFGLVYPDLGIIVLNPDAICPLVGFYTSGSLANSRGSGSATGSAMTITTTTPIYNSSNYNTPTNFAYAPVTHSITYTGNNAESAYNHAGLFYALRNAIDDATLDSEFRARSAETISSTHYFIRLRNQEFNYSNNPTFVNADNTLIVADFKTDPRVYITTVGLYNDANELLAVAKLSKPIRKSFDEEILLRVRLDF